MIEDTIPIKVELEEYDNTWIGNVKDENYPQFSGCLAQGDTKKEALKELTASVVSMLKFYEEEMHGGWKKAIFRGNYTRNQLWFTIIGVGMVFYWRRNSFSRKYPESRPKYSFHIANLWFSFKNEWTAKRK